MATKPTVIEFDKYREETNDPSELQRTKIYGPLTPDGSGQRVPNTGAVIDGVEYQLIGFGKRDKRPPVTLPADIDKFMKTFLNKAYTFQFTEELKVALLKKVAETSWPEVRRELKRLREDGVGPIGAVVTITSRKEEAVIARSLPQQNPVEAVGVEAYDGD